MSRLFNELVGSIDGAILVIGGGPSALHDLRELSLLPTFRPVAVLSANDHGFKQHVFECTHIVCADGTHQERGVPLEPILRAHGKPIITPAHFGDYRLPEWTLAANTGLTAIAVAVFMGARPVVAVGMDFYRLTSADVYFHDHGAASSSTKKTPEQFHAQINATLQWIGVRAAVRPTRGPLLKHYPPFDVAEKVAPRAVPPRARYLRGLATLIVECRTRPPLEFRACTIEPGRAFPVSPNEARTLCNGAGCRVVDAFPAPGQTEVRLPRDLVNDPEGLLPHPLQAPAERR